MIRIYGFDTRSRPAAIALAAAALAVGALFVAFGIVLLLGLAAVGTLVGAGLMLVRRLTGRSRRQIHPGRFDSELDPSLEVFPEPRAAVPPQQITSSQAHKPTG